MEGVYCGVRGIAVNWWDFVFWGSLNKIIDEGGCLGGGRGERKTN